MFLLNFDLTRAGKERILTDRREKPPQRYSTQRQTLARFTSKVAHTRRVEISFGIPKMDPTKMNVQNIGGRRSSRQRGLKEIESSESPDEPAAVHRAEEDHFRSIVSAYLGLGSNLGDRESNLRGAIDRIRSLGLVVVRSSSIYETEPVGYTDQPWFLNQVVELEAPAETCREEHGRYLPHDDVHEGRSLLKSAARDSSSEQRLQAEALLRELLEIEEAMGRKRDVPNGPRVIDIDLLLFGELIVGSDSNPAVGRDDGEPSRGERHHHVGILVAVVPGGGVGREPPLRHAHGRVVDLDGRRRLPRAHARGPMIM